MLRNELSEPQSSRRIVSSHVWDVAYEANRELIMHHYLARALTLYEIMSGRKLDELQNDTTGTLSNPVLLRWNMIESATAFDFMNLDPVVAAFVRVNQRIRSVLLVSTYPMATSPSKPQETNHVSAILWIATHTTNGSHHPT